jgi:hypothetical protein
MGMHEPYNRIQEYPQVLNLIFGLFAHADILHLLHILHACSSKQDSHLHSYVCATSNLSRQPTVLVLWPNTIFLPPYWIHKYIETPTTSHLSLKLLTLLQL